MLFMIIERFVGGRPDAVGERFRARGRQIPDDSGLRYVESWMSVDGTCCYQLMEASHAEALRRWIDAWRDLVDFEIVEVQTSGEYWSARAARERTQETRE